MEHEIEKMQEAAILRVAVMPTPEGMEDIVMRVLVAAMRSFLHLDPDIIMVGEMRDAETTQTGIEASLTGHLVLSALHTDIEKPLQGRTDMDRLRAVAV